LDRAIPLAVAARLHVAPEDATAYDEQPVASRLEQFLRGFIGSDSGAPVPIPPEAFTSDDFRRATEEVLRRQAASGEGVILGRASVVVLRDDPRVLRVRLDGPAERRVEQAMALDPELDRERAEQGLRRSDRTHAEYAHQLYGVEITDSRLYHLVLDSTALPLEACVEIVASAARAHHGARSAR
jgi:cytidylate kinase